MSKIYTVNNGKSEKEQIPSIEYINELTKMIEDSFIKLGGYFEGFQSIKTSCEELPITTVEDKSEILARDIKSDSQHRFVTDAVLATIIHKASKFDLDRSIDDVKSDLKSYMDNLYTRIVNTPNVINKLRDISTILNEDEVANGLLNTLSYKLNIEDFNDHKDSSIHMNNNDRKALNVLIKCLSDGFADWNAVDGASNAIKNKPESLPANGGNADTVSNHGIKDLINKDDYDIVIGTSTEKYSKDCCDVYAKDCLLDKYELNEALESMKGSGIILFKRGYYCLEHAGLNIICTAHRIFTGVDSRLSWIHTDKDTYIDNATFKNIGFNRTKIYIKSNCDMRNVRFANCEIILDKSEDCNITDCVFDSCTIKAEGNIMNNIIKDNRFIHTKPITYIGGNNIIKDNIY